MEKLWITLVCHTTQKESSWNSDLLRQNKFFSLNDKRTKEEVAPFCTDCGLVQG